MSKKIHMKNEVVQNHRPQKNLLKKLIEKLLSLKQLVRLPCLPNVFFAITEIELNPDTFFFFYLYFYLAL